MDPPDHDTSTHRPSRLRVSLTITPEPRAQRRTDKTTRHRRTDRSSSIAPALHRAAPRDGHFLIRRIKRQLQVSSEQRQQLRTILDHEKPTLQALATRLQQQNADLRHLPNPNEVQLRAFARQHECTSEDLLVEKEKLRRELLAVLTPAQQQKLQQMRAAREGAFTERVNALGDNL